jgi:hypothetical protein
MLNGSIKCDLQWFQFPDSDSEWVMEKEVSAADLISKFWVEVGVPRESFNGTLIECSAKFIGKLLGIYKYYQFANNMQCIAEGKEFFLRNGTTL